eukprot:gnl/MRDRNA2_/MRDRNA2_90500_c0_seq1.p1 gnl/MRDRNA2_/MRDRNA2_90500_c0~~gnl/MRDRNA2_/MRDRNA2_90500_c0_seq1.p1  ORF type:complete len:754 (+),score=179.82 gnl/MRDRNA2_/MRDRNA2_90500_c0_seq1:101-2362(+)
MMNQSFAVYSSNCAGAESKNAYAEAQFDQSQCFWSPADQSAFHQSAFHQYAQCGNNYWNYELHEGPTNYAWSQQAQQNEWHQDAEQSGKQSALACGVNLDDYSDFSDSEDEAVSKPLVVTQQMLPKSMSTDSVELDDTTSTDAASTGDAASNSNASDSSDVESEACSSPKACSRVHTRDALLLLRVAVGMCASPPARWSTQPREGAASSTPNAENDDCEWRREAAAKQGTGGKMKLVSSPNSWGAQQIQLARAGPTESDEVIVRGMKSILNKLTLEKFDALYEKLLNCGIRSDAHITLLVHEVFEKACLQHQFVDMYADLCMRLEKWLNIAQIGTDSNEFRRILLNQCQASFEASIAPATDENSFEDEEQRLEAATRHKQRVLGNIRFIAALLVRGMLAGRVLLSVAQTLLKDPSAPDALESLAVFLTNVGAQFDDKEWPHHALLCSIFKQVEDLSKSKEVAPRLRFLLKDVLDLRKDKWNDNKQATKKNEGPMTLKEVQRQIFEEDKAQMQALQTPKSRKSQDLKPTMLKSGSAAQKGSPKTNQSEKTQKSDGAKKADRDRKINKEIKKAAVTVAPPKAQHSDRKAAPPVAPPKARNAQPQTTIATPEPISDTLQQPNAPFDLRTFRRQLNEVLKQLGATRDTVSAFRRLGGLQVPAKFQATEFSNLVTRIAEERCAASRRVMFAFCASLAGKTFDRDMCAKGIQSFFDDVYEDLCEEVPRLPEILKNELVPTMSGPIGADKLKTILPAALK